MSQFFDGPTARLDAVLAGGRGADGSLGSDAQNRSVAAGRFRPSPYQAPLADVALAGGTFDRTYVWAWLGIADEPGPNNDYQSTQVRKCRVGLDVGYVYGPPAEMAPFVNLAAGTGEAATTAVTVARSRALSDAERIRRALCFPGLTANTGTGDVDPAVIGVYRDGESVLVDLQRGKLVCRTPFVVLVQANATTVYDP